MYQQNAVEEVEFRGRVIHLAPASRGCFCFVTGGLRALTSDRCFASLLPIQGVLLMLSLRRFPESSSRVVGSGAACLIYARNGTIELPVDDVREEESPDGDARTR